MDLCYGHVRFRNFSGLHSLRFINHAWVECDERGDELCTCVCLKAESYLSETAFPTSGGIHHLEPIASHVLIEVPRNKKQLSTCL